MLWSASRVRIVQKLTPSVSAWPCSPFLLFRNKHHPDLHLWACTGVRKDQDQITLEVERRVLAVPDTFSPPERTCHGQNHKEPPSLPPKMEETYITSEHSYQKPQSFSQDCKSMADPISSDDDDASSFDDEQELLLEDKNCLQYSLKEDGFGHQVKPSIHLCNFPEFNYEGKLPS